MNATSTVEVLIPHHSASVSKMSKKGWKCWAKLLIEAPKLRKGQAVPESYIATPLHAGSRTTLPVGSVVLHYDESDCAAVGVVEPTGEIEWLETTPCEGWVAGLWSASTAAFATPAPAEPASVDRASIIAKIRELMGTHGITLDELA